MIISGNYRIHLTCFLSHLYQCPLISGTWCLENHRVSYCFKFLKVSSGGMLYIYSLLFHLGWKWKSNSLTKLFIPIITPPLLKYLLANFQIVMILFFLQILFLDHFNIFSLNISNTLILYSNKSLFWCYQSTISLLAVPVDSLVW